MKPKLSHLAAAAALTGFLGFGGLSMAGAQEDAPTDAPAVADDGTTDEGTTPPEAGTTDEDCAGRGGARPGGSADDDAAAPATATSA